MTCPVSELIASLFKRASIRRSIPRSEPDRIADQCEQAAHYLGKQKAELSVANFNVAAMKQERDEWKHLYGQMDDARIKAEQELAAARAEVYAECIKKCKQVEESCKESGLTEQAFGAADCVMNLELMKNWGPNLLTTHQGRRNEA
jgi:hypothetical protein